ncbi:MAG TPA: hypothetical protein PK668_02490 [Myxococcota bacterium]|nr:hypothetical protein [Myxococcota bacterium]HRY94563.1 hypothetical protein [Myxococcota bacterium]HSA20171.1 hypothetical protein [Myxococcota bacterium]
MKIGKFWAKETVVARCSLGRKVCVDRWETSDESQELARRAAQESARRLEQKLAAGGSLDRYPYGVRPLREEILASFPGPDGKPVAVVTRNGYGCEVLNAARVMFVDVDLPTGGARAGEERRALERFERLVRERPDLSFRVYRTFGGLRGLATQAPLVPSPENLEVLTALDGDPLYLTLCREQACYRARLTPKPWRCGQRPIHISYPFEDSGQAERCAEWVAAYRRRQMAFATCELVKVLGRPDIHPELQPFVTLHDERTRVGSGLPLA